MTRVQSRDRRHSPPPNAAGRGVRRYRRLPAPPGGTAWIWPAAQGRRLGGGARTFGATPAAPVSVAVPGAGRVNRFPPGSKVQAQPEAHVVVPVVLRVVVAGELGPQKEGQDRLEPLLDRGSQAIPMVPGELLCVPDHP